MIAGGTFGGDGEGKCRTKYIRREGKTEQRVQGIRGENAQKNRKVQR